MRKGLFFGINYVKTPSVRLRGCINDVKNMSTFLKSRYGFDSVDVHTDEDHNPKTTARGILQEINNLAVDCWRDKVDVVWIHFSGHGTRNRDWSGDEDDGYDECIVPSDYKKSGLVPDDYIKRVLRNFPPHTKVIIVFDCCHSGTIGDLKYRYKDVENVIEENTQTPCPAHVIMLSGCTDNQTSADAYNVLHRRTFTGAMTSCLLTILNKVGFPPKVFDILDNVRYLLKEKSFTQYPQLSSSYKLSNDECLF